MKVYVLLDENNKVLNTTEIKLLENQIECDYDGSIEDLDVLNIEGFSVSDGKLIFDKEKVVKKSLQTEIVNTLNAMVLNVLPEGETLTQENVPSLLDIVNPATPEESGTQSNPIVIVDNDIAHNGYLCTYGKYYKWNNVVYQCKRTGESDGGTIKLFYTPDQLIGHYFVTV